MDQGLSNSSEYAEFQDIDDMIKLRSMVFYLVPDGFPQIPAYKEGLPDSPLSYRLKRNDQYVMCPEQGMRESCLNFSDQGRSMIEVLGLGS